MEFPFFDSDKTVLLMYVEICKKKKKRQLHHCKEYREVDEINAGAGWVLSWRKLHSHFRKESITIGRSLKKKVTQCHFLDEDALLEADTLSDIFPHPEPTKKTLHIVVRSLRVGECPPSVP